MKCILSIERWTGSLSYRLSFADLQYIEIVGLGRSTRLVEIIGLGRSTRFYAFWFCVSSKVMAHLLGYGLVLFLVAYFIGTITLFMKYHHCCIS